MPVNKDQMEFHKNVGLVFEVFSLCAILKTFAKIEINCF